jgi:pilus assembly protein TadC
VLEVAEFGGSQAPLASAAAKLQRGAPLLDVLDALPSELDAQWQPVATTLAVTATSGAPAIDAVRRLAAGLRVRRRRRCEERIRRLPVLLLLPLATLTLPAFVLVTFVPVAVAIGGRIPR